MGLDLQRGTRLIYIVPATWSNARFKHLRLNLEFESNLKSSSPSVGRVNNVVRESNSDDVGGRKNHILFQQAK